MDDEIKARKEMLRAEALRARGLLSLTPQEYKEFSALFFREISLPDDAVVAAYWPKDREFDVRPLIDDILERGYKVALPVTAKGSKVLQFARWHEDIDLEVGQYGINHPVLDADTEFLEPDVFLVPMLAFDRRGGRLGYGGGYYDSTLARYKAQKQILVVGVAYAQQACLFNLPVEEHDIKMDRVITQQQAYAF
jgi:5-formyltetrahydrofolate cyclo-ligase